MHGGRQFLIFPTGLWLANGAQALGVAAWIALDPRLSMSASGVAPVLFVLLACTGLCALICSLEVVRGAPSKTIGRLRVAAMGTVFMVTAFLGIRFYNHLTMSLALPLADDALDALDKALGLDWYGYAMWFAGFELWHNLIRLPYSHTTKSVAVIFVLLVFFGGREKAVEFGTLLFLGALIAVSVAAFFPAEAAMVRYMDAKILSIYGTNTGVYHMDALTALRGSAPVTLDFSDLPGLATFPSFHTITGLLIVYACRGAAIPLALACLWTGAMLLGTPIYGGHYFVDIFAGAAVAAALIAASRYRRRQLRGSAFAYQEPGRAVPGYDARHSA
jgi:hypothetical protein